jgi:hypothetical protein
LSVPAASATLPAIQTTPPPLAASSAGTAAPLALPASTPASNLEVARAAQQGAIATGAPLASVTTAAAPAPAPDKLDLAAAFSGFRPPADEQAAPSIAVDISKIAPARARVAQLSEDRGPAPGAPAATRRTVTAEPATTPTARKDPKAPAAKTDKTAKADATAKADKAKPAAKPAAPSHPSRIWVQIGVGRDKSALAFDWRKESKQAAELVKGKKAWTTPWGATNRLLVGPFESQAAAQAFLKAWKDKDSGAFVWTSPAGQAVDALVVK